MAAAAAADDATILLCRGGFTSLKVGFCAVFSCVDPFNGRAPDVWNSHLNLCSRYSFLCVLPLTAPFTPINHYFLHEELDTRLP